MARNYYNLRNEKGRFVSKSEYIEKVLPAKIEASSDKESFLSAEIEKVKKFGIFYDSEAEKFYLPAFDKKTAETLGVPYDVPSVEAAFSYALQNQSMMPYWELSSYIRSSKSETVTIYLNGHRFKFDSREEALNFSAQVIRALNSYNEAIKNGKDVDFSDYFDVDYYFGDWSDKEFDIPIYEEGGIYDYFMEEDGGGGEAPAYSGFSAIEETADNLVIGMYL